MDLANIIRANYPDAIIGPFADENGTNVVISNGEIEFWGLTVSQPTVEQLTTGLDAYYSARKDEAAKEVEDIILAWQIESVPLSKRSIYDRKERLALEWETATTEERALAVKEFEGYTEIMQAQGLEAIELYLFNTVPVDVRTLDDLLFTYRTNGRLYRAILAEAEKWRNKYPMMVKFLPTSTEQERGEFEGKVAEIKAEVIHNIENIPTLISQMMS